MRTFTDTIIQRLLRETAAFYFLIDLELASGTLYLTDMDIVYYYNDHAYQPEDMSVGEITGGSDMQVSTLDFTLQNVDQQMASYFLNDEQRGREVTIRFACFSGQEAALIDAAEGEILDESGENILGPTPGIATLPLFRGLISNWRFDELDMEINLKNELVLWKKRTLRKSRVLCPWTFKGTECGYSGESSSCDKTYDRCAVLSNTDNFGGFRWVADMMEKEIQWGPQ